MTTWTTKTQYCQRISENVNDKIIKHKCQDTRQTCYPEALRKLYKNVPQEHGNKKRTPVPPMLEGMVAVPPVHVHGFKMHSEKVRVEPDVGLLRI